MPLQGVRGEPGELPGHSYRSLVMAVNPDPKPGRWILPLVILAMIAFTYFFVSALPEASPDTTLVGSGPTTTTLAPGTETTSPGDGGGDLDPETQAYLDEVDAINAELQVLDTEMITVNAGFDAEPREIPFDEAESRLEAVANDTTALAARLAGLTPPTGLETNHQALQSNIDLCAAAADEALAGLRSTDTGELRQAAAAAYSQAASDFDTEVQNTHGAANSQ